MNWRHELKFLIDETTFLRLLYTLKPVLGQDPYAHSLSDSQESGYKIRSLYFDDYAHHGIYEKLIGVDPRHKYRIRIYNDDDTIIRLEKKIKAGSLSRKESCLLTKATVDSLINGDAEPLFLSMKAAQSRSEFDLLGQFYSDWQTRMLRPKILVDYIRIPFLWTDGRVRITFDRYLSTGFFRQDLTDPQAAMKTVVPSNQVILEVKYDAYLPEFISDLIRLPGMAQLSVSKYVQCALSTGHQTWESF